MSNCEEEKMIWECPVCGLPIEVGKCPGGCDVEIKYYNSATDLWDDIIKTDSIISFEILDHGENWVSAIKIGPNEEKQRRNWTLAVYSALTSNLLYEGAKEFIKDFLYYKDCGRVEGTIEQYKEIRENMNKKRHNVQLTRNEYKTLQEAAKYYKLKFSLILDCYAMKVRDLMSPEQE